MALVQGTHILAHGDKADARRIVADIQMHQRLLVGTGTVDGAGAYAWYSHLLPPALQKDPQVIFTVDDSRIVEVCRRDGTSRGYFRIPGSIGDYVSITVITFRNLS
jgi:hypothetical protein